MNCPQCQQPVGQDRHAIGPWRDERVDNEGRTEFGIRTIYLQCEHCGTFTVRQLCELGQLRVCGITRHRCPDIIRRVQRRLPAVTLMEAVA